MNKRIIIFNLAFYIITLLLYSAARKDASSSLGYGFLLVIFWGAALLTLVILLATKIIQPRSMLDKVGVVMATPIFSLIIVTFAGTFSESQDSEWQFNNGGHRYRLVKYAFRNSGRTKRIEYYKSVDTVSPDSSVVGVEKWKRDSTWIYFTEKGDTLKTVKYRNNVEVK